MRHKMGSIHLFSKNSFILSSVIFRQNKTLRIPLRVSHLYEKLYLYLQKFKMEQFKQIRLEGNQDYNSPIENGQREPANFYTVKEYKSSAIKVSGKTSLASSSIRSTAFP